MMKIRIFATDKNIVLLCGYHIYSMFWIKSNKVKRPFGSYIAVGITWIGKNMTFCLDIAYIKYEPRFYLSPNSSSCYDWF